MSDGVFTGETFLFVGLRYPEIRKSQFQKKKKKNLKKRKKQR